MFVTGVPSGSALCQCDDPLPSAVFSAVLSSSNMHFVVSLYTHFGRPLTVADVHFRQYTFWFPASPTMMCGNFVSYEAGKYFLRVSPV